MKRILLTSVSLGVLGMVSPALGADLPYAKAPSAAASVYDWTGVYVGGFAGGGFGNHNYNNGNGPTGNANFTVNYDSTGGIGGGEVGYNWQSGNFITGVEADGFWSGIKGGDASQALGLGVLDQSNLRWGGTLRARGGIAVDRLLLFFTGGWAFGDILHTSTAPGVPVDQFTNNRSGLAAGGGIAYAITNNVIGKLEYRYYDFGRYGRTGTPLTGLTPNGQLPYSVNSTYSVLTVGFDVKFGGPVVAKY
jgi:outer membrane immunogenic protein